MADQIKLTKKRSLGRLLAFDLPARFLELRTYAKRWLDLCFNSSFKEVIHH